MSHGQAYPISDVANEISLMDVELKPFTEPTEPLEAAVQRALLGRVAKIDHCS